MGEEGLAERVSLAVVTEDGKLFYEFISELKRRGIKFLAKAPNESLPLTVKAVLTSKSELSKVLETVKPGVKVIACKPGEAVTAVSKALLAIYGFENETFTVGIDPGKTTGFAVVVGGIVVFSDSFGSFQRLQKAFEKFLNDWKPKRVVVKVGSSSKNKIKTSIFHPLKLKSFLEELSRRLGVVFTLKFVNEAGTTVKAKRKKAKHVRADEASAVEIALKET